MTHTKLPSRVVFWVLEHTLKDHLLNMLERIFHDTHSALVVVEVFITYYLNYFLKKSADLGYFPNLPFFLQIWLG